MGYHGTITPSVIQRNVIENPGWYTQYTPYQAEISQGRLELLLNFQTMIADLTGLPIANASLLDEGTAAAEAMAMALNIADAAPDRSSPRTLPPADARCPAHAVRIDGRGTRRGGPVRRGFDATPYAGVLVQYPDTSGVIHGLRPLVRTIKDAGAVAVMAADPLALTLLTPPASSGPTSRRQRAALRRARWAGAARTRPTWRHTSPTSARCPDASSGSPGRTGKPALRLTLQTREQHIRRDRRPPTSAPPRCCSPSWRPATACTTARPA
jgi:glycine dehydrogenase